MNKTDNKAIKAIGDKYPVEWVIDVGGAENNPLSDVIDAMEGRIKD